MTIGIYKQSAKDIMTKHVATVRGQETVHDALLLMSEDRLSVLPVVDPRERCVGIISQSDLIAVAREADTEDDGHTGPRSFTDLIFGTVPLQDITHERIADVMSENVVTVGPDDPVVDVAEKMLAHEVHHVPVCNEDGKLLGIISTMDILSGLRTSTVV